MWCRYTVAPMITFKRKNGTAKQSTNVDATAQAENVCVHFKKRNPEQTPVPARIVNTISRRALVKGAGFRISPCIHIFTR